MACCLSPVFQHDVPSRTFHLTPGRLIRRETIAHSCPSVFNSQHFHTTSLVFDTTPADLGVVAVQEPQFGDERSFHYAAMEDPDHTTLRNDDCDGAQLLRHRGSREMPAA